MQLLSWPMAASQTWLTVFPLRHARYGCTGGTPTKFEVPSDASLKCLKKKKVPIALIPFMVREVNLKQYFKMWTSKIVSGDWHLYAQINSKQTQ